MRRLCLTHMGGEYYVSFDVGPFRLYRSGDGSLSISLIAFDDLPFGWEYGWRDILRGEEHPLVSIRVGKLMMCYFERHENGFEIWLMGFWWIK